MSRRRVSSLNKKLLILVATCFLVLGLLIGRFTFPTVSNVEDDSVKERLKRRVEDLEKLNVTVVERSLPSNLETAVWIQHWNSFVYIINIQLDLKVAYIDREVEDRPILWFNWAWTIGLFYP